MQAATLIPGSTYLNSGKVNWIRLSLVLLVLTPLSGFIGTCYGFATRMGVHYLVAEDEELGAGLGIFIFGMTVLGMKALIHWSFNSSHSRNPNLNRLLIAIIACYFWYCSYTGLVFDDFLWSDVFYGMTLSIPLYQLADLFWGYDSIWTLMHALELIIMLVLFVGFYKLEQDLYCENCQQYLTVHDFYMIGTTQFPKDELQTGSVMNSLTPLHFLSPGSFDRYTKRSACLELRYQTCKTCDLGVVTIDEGMSIPSNRNDHPKTSFKKQNSICERLIVDKESKDYLDG